MNIFVISVEQWKAYLNPMIILSIMKINFAGYQNFEYFHTCLCLICRKGLQKFNSIGLRNENFPITNSEYIQSSLLFFSNQITYLEKFLARNFFYEIFHLSIAINFKCKRYASNLSDNSDLKKLETLKRFYFSTDHEMLVYDVINFKPMLEILGNETMSNQQKLMYFLKSFRYFQKYSKLNDNIEYLNNM